MFNWLATGGVLQTAVLDPTEAQQLLDSIVVSTSIGLRERALIALLAYSFTRIAAAIV